MAPHRGTRGNYGQSVVNVMLPVSGLGNARVNHNAELRIFVLNQKISPYHLHKQCICPRTHTIIPATWKCLIYAPKQYIHHPWPAVYSFVLMFVLNGLTIWTRDTALQVFYSFRMHQCVRSIYLIALIIPQAFSFVTLYMSNVFI